MSSASEVDMAMDDADAVPLTEIEDQPDAPKPELREDIVDGVQSMNIVEEIAKQEEKKDGPRPRLVIQSLILDNFKSYGGTVKIGPFHKRFSSIVGPNGSGKSNVIDAMLFVFGRRAKQLRHSKMSELLHHSDTYPDVRTGTVTVNFREIIDTGDADDDYEVVKNSEFSVARKAFKNNTSKYYLNEKETQMKHVITLLKSKGVDLDNNRFLILQGEVEQIAMMKPKAVNAHEDGLLEYLEDIIGTNQYVEEIDTLSAQVETLNEERTHKLNRVKAVQKERDALEGAKTEAETLLEKEREFYNKKGIFIKSRINEHLRDLKEHTGVLEEAKGKLDESKKLFEEREKHVAGFDEEFNARKKTADHLRKKLNKALNDYAVFERRDIELREDLKALKAKSKKLDSSLERENGKKEKAEEHIKTHEQEVSDAEKECKEVEKSLQKAESALEKIHHQTREKTAPIRAKLEDKQKELMPFTDTINKCTQDVEVAKTELKLLLEERDAPAKELAEQEKVLEAVRTELNSANEKIQAIQNEEKACQGRLKELSKIEKESKDDIAKNTSVVHDLQRKVAEFQQSSNDSSSRNRVQSGLHKAMKDGRITGVIGRLGDLASVAPKYDIAVGAAAGSRLDNIVVKSTDSAQACIHLLRRENLGRATFVILDKIQHLEKQIGSWKPSPNETRLFDCLEKVKSEHKIALYHVLGNTLVANNMEEARRMAFKPTRKDRVVTVSGELIESSGAMSGGGRAPPRHRLGKGGNSFDVDPEAMQKAVKELERVQNLMNQSQNNLSSVQKERSSLSLKVEEIESNQRKTNLNIQSLKERVNSLENTRIPELKKAIMAAKKAEKGSEGKKIGNMEKDIAQLMKQVEQANKSCEGIQKAILQLQEEIVAAGGEKMQKAKESVESYREQLSTEKSKAAKAAALIKESNKIMKKASDSITRITKQIEENSAKRDAGKKEKRSLEEQAAEMVGTHDDAKQKYDDALKLQIDAQEEYQKVKEELKAQRREEVTLKERFTNAERNYKICKNEVKDGKKELNSITRNVKRINDTIYGALGPETEEKIEDESKDDEEDDDGDKMDDDDDEFEDAMDEQKAEKEKEEEDDQDVDQEDGGILSPAEKSRLVNEISALQNIVADKTADIRAIAEYKKKENECREQEKELDRVTENRDEVRKSHDKLCKRRHDEFKSGFDEICKKLKELYQMITLGGDAELEFVDSMYPFTEGIVFSVRPPKKSWKNISNLSGGEKTLSSLALVFALHYYKPTPLYFLDEIDAALDFKNVSIVANYVKERTKDAQFIIISLRNNMFELADRLVGIYKTHHSTKSVTVNPKAFVIPPPGVPATQIDTSAR